MVDFVDGGEGDFDVYEFGTLLKLHSLSKVEYNDELVECGKKQINESGEERYAVRFLKDDKKIAIKTKNLAIPAINKEARNQAIIYAADAEKLLKDVRASGPSKESAAKLSTAEEKLNKAINIDFSYGHAHRLLGDYYHMRGDTKAVCLHHQRAVANNCTDIMCRFSLSMAYSNMNDFYNEYDQLKRIIYYFQGIPNDPKELQARIQIIDCLLFQDNYFEQAYIEMKKLFDLKKLTKIMTQQVLDHFVDLRRKMCQRFREAKNFTKVAEIYQSIIQYDLTRGLLDDENRSQIEIGLAEALGELGLFIEGRQILEKSLYLLKENKLSAKIKSFGLYTGNIY